MHCRFEDRSTGRARVLSGLHTRIVAESADAVPEALARIAAAQAEGRWVALMLDYELGEWLEPAVLASERHDARQAGSTATGNGSMHVLRPSPDRASDDFRSPATSRMAGDPAGIAAPGPRLTALVFDTMTDEDAWTSPPAGEARVVSVQPRVSQTDYVAAVEEIRQLIAQGDVYQINYTMPLDVRTEGAPQDVYVHLAERQTAAHCVFIDDLEDGGRAVLSFSPELFLRRRGARLESRPMKGTAPRSADPAEDRQLGEALLASAKNRAENVMIVDLIRNDLGRVAQAGSVQVDALLTLEQYPQVWTLTSTVSATLDAPSLADILHALFPCGSITGAPKIAAMRHIRRLEAAPRGLYCGALGWLAPNGDFDLNVSIRTLVLDAQGRGVYGVGGGIVYDSDPLNEWEECLWKARVVT